MHMSVHSETTKRPWFRQTITLAPIPRSRHLTVQEASNGIEEMKFGDSQATQAVTPPVQAAVKVPRPVLDYSFDCVLN